MELEMKNIIMRYSPKKDVETYQNNIEKSYELSHHLIYSTRKCIQELNRVPKRENFLAMSKTEILKDEAFNMEKTLLQLKIFLNDVRFQNSILEFWNLNEEGIKYHHGYKIDDFDKFQFYNRLKREVDLMNDENEDLSEKKGLFEISESIMFVNKSMRSMHFKNKEFFESVDMPKTVPCVIFKILNKINTDILKEETLEEQKILTQSIWKDKVRENDNFKKYLQKR
jgi:hypothetical protein